MSNFEPNIIGFLCNWCSYAGADLAGTSRMKYPANLKTIRVMCTGRLNPMLLIYALLQGADGVLVSGCHPGECHYKEGNYLARRRVTIARQLAQFMGINPKRIRMSWVSASEGGKFSEVVEKVTNDIKEIGPNTYPKRDNSTW